MFQLVKPLFKVPAGYAINLNWATKQLFDHSQKKILPFSDNCHCFALGADVAAPCLCFALGADVAAPCLCFASRRFYRADVAAPVFATNDVFG